jgi:hypothetical protein
MQLEMSTISCLMVRTRSILVVGRVPRPSGIVIGRRNFGGWHTWLSPLGIEVP